MAADPRWLTRGRDDHSEARFSHSSQPASFKSQGRWELVLRSDVKLSERFESVKRTIYGIGFTCVVVMGVNKMTKEEVAIKVIMKGKLHTHGDLERALFELDVHSKLVHPNLLPFLGGEETADSVIIITPLARGDLNSMSMNKVFAEDNCRRLCRQLLRGLEHLHGQGLVHCDIKPQNVLLFPSSANKYIAKICDFGFTERIGPDGLIRSGGMRGSLGYFSPEQLKRLPYGQPVDMFALGIMTYTLLCGYEPFYPANKAGFLTGDATKDSKLLVFEAPYWDGVSQEAKSFLRGLLHGDPGQRLTAAQALADEWFQLPAGTPSTGGEDADIQFE